MQKVTIYHNPKCSKSRQTLGLLEERGISPEIVLYLQTAPTATEIKGILAKLGFKARQLIRKGETVFGEMGLSNEALTEDELIDAMVKAPILIERPIVIAGQQARLGRPPEQVLEILG